MVAGLDGFGGGGDYAKAAKVVNVGVVEGAGAGGFYGYGGKALGAVDVVVFGGSAACDDLFFVIAGVVHCFLKNIVLVVERFVAPVVGVVLENELFGWASRLGKCQGAVVGGAGEGERRRIVSGNRVADAGNGVAVVGILVGSYIIFGVDVAVGVVGNAVEGSAPIMILFNSKRSCFFRCENHCENDEKYSDIQIHLTENSNLYTYLVAFCNSFVFS